MSTNSSTKNRLQLLLETLPCLLADGAIGTNLFAMGLPIGHAPELWNLEQPEKIALLHKNFIEAGADIILTNSFGGTRHRLKLHKAEDRMSEINETAARIARQVADNADRDVVVAGSMGPTGELFEPLGPLSPEEGTAAFAEQAQALARGGADVLWIETLSSREEVEAAVSATATTLLPVVVTLSFDTNGSTMMGINPGGLAALCGELAPRPLAWGTNCGVGAAEVVACIVSLAAASGPGQVLVAKANCGVPQWVDGAIRYDATPEVMADYARLARDAGARIIGGCCGTTPAHLRAMRHALDTHTSGEAPDSATITTKLGEISDGAKRHWSPDFDSASGVVKQPRRSRRRRAREGN